MLTKKGKENLEKTMVWVSNNLTDDMLNMREPIVISGLGEYSSEEELLRDNKKVGWITAWMYEKGFLVEHEIFGRRVEQVFDLKWDYDRYETIELIEYLFGEDQPNSVEDFIVRATNVLCACEG